MKNMKKITLFILALCSMFAFVYSNRTVNAQFEEFYREKVVSEKTIFDRVTWTNIIAETQTNKASGLEAGYGSTGNCENYKWYSQQINVLSVPRFTTSDGSQKYEVVAYSIQGDEQWDFSGMTKMAADFELNNPDYIVLGGINGDFYDWHSTLDYPNSGNGVEVQRGEVIRTVKRAWGAVGVKNNGELDQLVFVDDTLDSVSANPYLTVYSNTGEELLVLELDGMNLASLDEGQTSAYFGYLDGEKGTNSYGENTYLERNFHAPTFAEGNRFVVLNGDKVVYQEDSGSYYGKGKITNVNDGTELVSNSFGIVTKNQQLLELLAKDVVIRVQYQLVGELAGVNDVLGCSHMLIDEGQFSQYYDSESYYTTRAPRTIIGSKADGTICLITMDGRQADKGYYGTNQQEINAVLEALDIDDAYLLDGGGSTTFFVRENGEFVIKNSPSDGNQRSVSNGFLIVTKKDDSVNVKNVEAFENSLDFYLDTENLAQGVSQAYIEVNGELKPFVNGKATFENLTSNTEYSYNLYYDANGYEGIMTTNSKSATTLKKTPNVSLGEFTWDDEYVYPVIVFDDPDGALLMIQCEINGRTDTIDISNPENISKIKISNADEGFVCNISFRYRLGSGQPMLSGTLQYEYEGEVEDNGNNQDNNSQSGGCGVGAYMVYALLPLGLLPIFRKRK